MESAKNIYLIGTVAGPKWELIKDIDKAVANFYSSDCNDHSEHGWGFAYYDFGSLKEQVCSQSYLGLLAVIPGICRSDYLIAYLHTPTSFGSIAEIAYASAMGKRVYMIINTNQKPQDIGLPEFYMNMHDSYWLVSNFPNVKPIEVDSLEKAKQVVESIVCRNNYKVYLQTDHWKAIRQQKLNQVGNRCQLCNQENPQVHHRIYEPFFEKMEDLTALCSDCHSKFHRE